MIMLHNLFSILTGLFIWQQQQQLCSKTLEKNVQLHRADNWKLCFELLKIREVSRKLPTLNEQNLVK